MEKQIEGTEEISAAIADFYAADQKLVQCLVCSLIDPAFISAEEIKAGIRDATSAVGRIGRALRERERNP